MKPFTIRDGSDLRRFRRTVARMTQEQIAAVLGCSQSHVANIERGHYGISAAFAWDIHHSFPTVTVDLGDGMIVAPDEPKEVAPDVSADRAPFIMGFSIGAFLGLACGVAMGVAL